ncbi:MAG: ATP-grasp domain-containing protein, partial [Chloroflexi bacterium]|nr:ATP-grasp domain-containing protein [Chloroflexota bacterium]
AFPLIDPDIPVLSRNAEALAEVGARAAVVPPEAVAIASDKWLTLQLFQRLGVPAPPSWLPGEGQDYGVEYPLFIKPRNGSAGKLAFKVNDERELAFFSEYVPNPIIQECLSGPEITSDVICDLDSNVLAVVSRQRIQVRGGEAAKSVTIYDERIINYCGRIVKALRAIGPITVQCMMQDGQPFFTEINARFGGGAPLGIAAGVPYAHWYVAMAARKPLNVPPTGSYKVGVYLTRFDDSFFLTQEDYARIEGRRIMKINSLIG